MANWIDKSYSIFWDEISVELSGYFSNILSEINLLESSHSVVNNIPIMEIESKLLEIKKKRFQKNPVRLKSVQTQTLSSVLENEDFILIEGGMGTGKSTLFRRYIRSLAMNKAFQKNKILPSLIHFKEIIENPLRDINNKIDELSKIIPDEDVSKYIFIDGLDEVQDSSIFIELLPQLSQLITNHGNVKIILGSRPIWDIEDEEILFKYLKRYSISPLSTEQLYKVIKFTCSELKKSLSDRLIKDLNRSENTLLRTLPKTPMSAILLAKVLSSDIKELPQTLPELYSKYIELSLGRWDISRGLMAEREYPIIAKFLGNLATYMLDNQLHEIALSEIQYMLQQYVNAREGLPSSTDLLQKILQRTEIVNVNKSKQTFMFRHKSFAEYLYAFSIKNELGKNAPIKNPFEGYWLGVEYFYVGLIQDCGVRIENLSQFNTDFPEKERILRAYNLGDLMLAAYQTEYNFIEDALYNIYLDVADLFIEVKKGEKDSPLRIFPELQLFAILTFMLKEKYEYEYFRKALSGIQIRCQIDQNLNKDKQYIMSFLIDATRYGLNEDDVFEFLTNEKLSDLPWVVTLGIKHVSEHVSGKTANKLPHIKKLMKRIMKTTRNNLGLVKYLQDLYEKPLLIRDKNS